MARNGHTSHGDTSATDARKQYELPWSPAEQAQVTPADTQVGDPAALPVESNVATVPIVNDGVSLNAVPTAPEATLKVSERSRKTRPPLSLRARVERLLRDRAVPYVNVDDAKRALFSSATLRAFHFVAYRAEGPNWLIFAAKADRQARETMAEWERVFGEGFVAVLALPAKGEPTGIRFRALDGRPLSFEPPVTEVGESHNTEGGEPC